MRKFLLFLLTAVLVIPLTGCWNYRSLDEIDIVVGIAIDYDSEENLFNVMYETANLLDAGEKGSIKGRFIQTQGKTLFDAARNAKRKEKDRLFFGSSQVLVVSQQLAKEEGLLKIIDWFLRDGECRETLCVAISTEDSAQAIFGTPDETTGIVSANLHDIIREDKKVTGTTPHNELYKIYNELNSAEKSMLLPALRKVKSADEIKIEIFGSAVIKNDRLEGFLNPDQSKYALIMDDELEGGILTLSMPGESYDSISLEIFKNKTEKSYSYKKNKVTVNVQTKTDVAIGENQSRLDIMDEKVVKQIQAVAQRKIEENIRNLTAVSQQTFNADIFGFGEMIYKKDLSLWRKLAPEWPEIYPEVELKVSSKVNIINSAFLK